jgi:hypothetical protein
MIAVHHAPLCSVAARRQRCSKQNTSFMTRRPSTPYFRMSTFWSDACSHAEQKTMQERLDSAYGSCGTTVHAPLPLPAFVSLFCSC